MSIFRQYIAPFLIVLVFLVALLAVSARIFLPSDMVAPAPIEEMEPQAQAAPERAIADLSSTTTLDILVKGLPDPVDLTAPL